MTKLRLLMATSLIAISAAATANAQQLEEIIVSARKVDENLMQVPLAVTAFSAKDIEEMGIKQPTDLALMTPSFTFVNQNGGSGRNDRSGASMVFRGLYLSGAGGGTMFIDGAPINGTQAPSFSDVERVEVLKGPQSVYFGRSTFAGAINFIMREPSNEFKGRVSAEYGSYGNNEESISVEGPIVEDKLAARLSARYYYRGGQYTNWANTSEKLGSQSTKSVSLSSVYTPSDSLKVKLYANYFRDSDGTPAQGVLQAESVNCFPAAGRTIPAGSRAATGYFCGELPTMSKLPAFVISADSVLTSDIRTRMYDNAPSRWLIQSPYFNNHFGLEREAFQIDIRADWDFADGYTLSSLTAYHTNKTAVVLDSTYRAEGHQANLLYNRAGVANSSTFPTNFTYMRQTQGFNRDWSQELRVASPQDNRLRWTVGGNYLRNSSPGGSVFGVDVRGLAFAGSVSRSRPVTYAAFGGLYFDILENVTLSAEARRQWDKTKTIPVVGTNGNYVASTVQPSVQMFKSFTPRVSLDWKFAPNSTVYGLWSRGYRPGGVNAALLNSDAETIAQIRQLVPNAGVNFLPEKLENFEAGIKHTFLDNRARVALSVFYLNYLNGQQGASVPVRTSAGVTNLIGITVNTATAKLKGYELEGEFQVTEQFKLSGNMGLNDSKISTTSLAVYNCADCLHVFGDPKAGLGNRMPTVPKWTWAMSATYTDRLTDNWDWNARVDYSHRGMSFVDYTATSWIGASDNINLSLGVRNETLSISAFVNNLTQNDKLASALGGTFDVQTFAYSTAPILQAQQNAIRMSFPLKRVFGMRAAYNF